MGRFSESTERAMQDMASVSTLVPSVRSMARAILRSERGAMPELLSANEGAGAATESNVGRLRYILDLLLAPDKRTEAIESLVTVAFADYDAGARGLAMSVLLELLRLTESAGHLVDLRDEMAALVADNLRLKDHPCRIELGLAWLASLDGLWIAKEMLERVRQRS